MRALRVWIIFAMAVAAFGCSGSSAATPVACGSGVNTINCVPTVNGQRVDQARSCDSIVGQVLTEADETTICKLADGTVETPHVTTCGNGQKAINFGLNPAVEGIEGQKAAKVTGDWSINIETCELAPYSPLPALGSNGTSSPRPAPTVPSDGGMVGTWSYVDNSQVVTIRFDTKGISDEAKDAEACRAAMNGASVVWVIVSAENKTGDQTSLGIVTIVSGDGHQYSADSAVDALNGWYSNAPESKARADCVATNQAIAATQYGSAIAPGATFSTLDYLPATVTTVKSVTAYGNGSQEITLTYNP